MRCSLPRRNVRNGDSRLVPSNRHLYEKECTGTVALSQGPLSARLMGSLCGSSRKRAKEKINAAEPCFSPRETSPRSHLVGSSLSPDLSVVAPCHSRRATPTRAALALNTPACQHTGCLPQHGQHCLR